MTLTIEILEIAKCIPTPDNPRIFSGPDEKNPQLVELAQSIKAMGVLEPLLGRPHASEQGCVDLRAGERRLRAARLAGLTEVPVIVRDMSDEEAFNVTVTENIQREGLHPLEEASGIEKMRNHGWTFEQIADTLGRSPKWVARRTSLANLSDDWRAAAMSGFAESWTAAHFEMIARFPENVQAELLKHCDNEFGGPYSLPASIKTLREVTRDYLYALDLAPWDLDDASFDGCCCCTDCPKRSDIEPLLFDDADYGEGNRYKPGARCLDVDCWNSKRAQYLERRLDEVQDKHGAKPVLVTSYRDPVLEDKKIMKHQAVSEYEVVKCKKTEPGAIPCVKPDGSMFWGKKGASKGATSGNKPATSLAEKRARLQKRRDVAVLKHLLEKIPEDACDLKDVQFSPQLPPRLALVFGSRHPNFDDSAWIDLESWRDRSNDEVATELVLQACVVIQSRIQVTINIAPARHALDMSEAKALCDLFGWDYEYMQDQAVIDIPEPKSWAKEEAAEKAEKKGAKKKKNEFKKASKPEPGVCRVCGCTENSACDGGCYWADDTFTLCSECVELDEQKPAKPKSRKPRTKKAVA